MTCRDTMSRRAECPLEPLPRCAQPDGRCWRVPVPPGGARQAEPCSPAAVTPPCGIGSGSLGAPPGCSSGTPQHQQGWHTSMSPGCCPGTPSHAPGSCSGAAGGSAPCPGHRGAFPSRHPPPRTIHIEGRDAGWCLPVPPLHGDVDGGGGLVGRLQRVVSPDEEAHVGHLQPGRAADLTRHCRRWRSLVSGTGMGTGWP